jgi:hypothetical protein
MAESPTIDPAALTAAYEALRARVVGDPVVGRPSQGLALLYRRGLPAWLAEMSQPAVATVGSVVGDQSTVTTTVAASARSTETVLVVASMVLASHAGEQP